MATENDFVYLFPVKTKPITITLYGEQEKVTTLIGESALETQLLRELVLSRLSPFGRNFDPLLDSVQTEGDAPFALIREGSKAYAWFRPIQFDNGHLEVLSVGAGKQESLQTLFRSERGRKLCALVERRVADTCLAKLSKMIDRWIGLHEGQAEPYFHFNGFHGSPVVIDHPDTGAKVEVCWMNIGKPNKPVFGGYENRDFVRSPRTDPRIVSRPCRIRIPAQKLPASALEALIDAFEPHVDTLESDLREDDEG